MRIGYDIIGKNRRTVSVPSICVGSNSSSFCINIISVYLLSPTVARRCSTLEPREGEREREIDLAGMQVTTKILCSWIACAFIIVLVHRTPNRTTKCYRLERSSDEILKGKIFRV